MSEHPSPEAGGHPLRRGANLTLLVAGLLLFFTVAAFYTGKSGRVGYGWATLGALAALAASGWGMRQGAAWGPYAALGLLALLLGVWGFRFLQGMDLGLGIWAAICLIALREVWSALPGRS